MPAPITSLGAETSREKGRICARRGWNPKTEFYGDPQANALVMEGYEEVMKSKVSLVHERGGQAVLPPVT